MVVECLARWRILRVSLRYVCACLVSIGIFLLVRSLEERKAPFFVFVIIWLVSSQCTTERISPTSHYFSHMIVLFD